MNFQKITIKHLLSVFLILIMLSPETIFSSAKILGILLGEDPRDAEPAYMDILEVYMTNNGTCLQFVINCRERPKPSHNRLYVVWLDTKGDDEPDYCLAASNINGLYKVTIKRKSVRLKYVAPTEVEVEGCSIYLTVKLCDIKYPNGVKDTVGIMVTTHKPLPKIVDRAPDSGRYLVDHKVVSGLPNSTILIFIPSLILSIYMIYQRKFKNG